MRTCRTWLAWLWLLACSSPAWGAERLVPVGDDASLRAALRKAGPGSVIRIAAGRYQPGVYVAGLKGTEQEPVLIEGIDEANPPVFEGGSQAWHLSDCAHVTLRNIAVRGQTGNGINVDDGGTLDTPAQHIVLEKIRVSDIGPRGNRDGIKLSGVDDFVVRACTVEGWGGQAVDMVGCHRGVIEECTFRGKEGFSQDTGPQTKGGSSQVVIRRCLFLDAGGRAVNLGGSTGLAFFRPKGALYEAKDIRVEGCTFVGSQAPVAFVGVYGAVVQYNTIYRPRPPRKGSRPAATAASSTTSWSSAAPTWGCSSTSARIPGRSPSPSPRISGTARTARRPASRRCPRPRRGAFTGSIRAWRPPSSTSSGRRTRRRPGSAPRPGPAPVPSEGKTRAREPQSRAVNRLLGEEDWAAMADLPEGAWPRSRTRAGNPRG